MNIYLYFNVTSADFGNLQREIESPLSKRMLQGEFGTGDVILVDADLNADNEDEKTLKQAQITFKKESVQLSDLQWNRGVGVTIDLPIGPMRIDYAESVIDAKINQIHLGFLYSF